MMLSTPADSTPVATLGRLRLKRLFLRALVISLAAGVLIGVGALLLPIPFGRTTQNILGTLAALVVYCGLALGCADTLEKQRWPRLSATLLVLLVPGFLVLLTCIWARSPSEELLFRGVLTTLVLFVAYPVAIPSADLLERGQQRGPATVALGSCAIAVLLLLTGTWTDGFLDDETSVKTTATACVVALSCAHMCVLLRVPGSATLGTLTPATMGCLWLVAALIVGAIWAEVSSEWYYRVLGALAVLAVGGSLGVLMLAKLRQVRRLETLESAVARVELRCPRCTQVQTVDAGASRCVACGLKFRLDVEEPRCEKCGYLLWQLPERRCPECGTPF